MAGLIQITLREPAKIDGKRREAGETVSVSAEVAAQLGEVVIGEQPMADPDPASNAPFVAATDIGFDFDAAVQVAATRMAGAAFDGALGKLEDELKEIVAASEVLEAEKSAALARVAEVEAERDRLAERVAELEAQIASTAPPTEPAVAEAITPSKRGSKAAKG